MSSVYIKPRRHLNDYIDVVGDKSISHRAVMFSLLCSQTSRIKGFLEAHDTMDTLRIAQNLGLHVERSHSELLLTPNAKGIIEPNEILYCGNAGTALRLYCGLLAGQKGVFILDGDNYLRLRPMKRVVAPLSQMNAKIWGRKEHSLAPLAICGSQLHATDYHSPISSAQVKSAFMLAALNADAKCRFSEPQRSRDHTEKMLSAMGAKIDVHETSIEIHPLQKPLEPLDFHIPADPSSAFFFAVATAITPGSDIILRNVLLNPTRIEGYEILRKMGAKISYIRHTNPYEEVGDIHVCYGGTLQAVHVSENIAWLIDEIPALSIAFACAKGKSKLTGAKELRVKETDRIKAITLNLESCGIDVDEYDDGFEIVGGNIRSDSTFQSFGDHRIAMSFALLGLLVPVRVDGSEAMAVSFPSFLEILKRFVELEER